jgi:uncharacterized protein with NRDE domain
LLVIVNRDEYLARATERLHRWDEGFWAGKDLVANGTWLGLSPGGRFGAITNHRTLEAQDPQALSRGDILRRYFTSGLSANAFAESLERCAKDYKPFNLLLFDNNSLVGIEGGRTSRPFRIIQMATGYGSVSNGSFLERWPKTERLQQHLNVSIANGGAHRDALLFEMLGDQTVAPDHLLPNTGLPLERESALSSIFVSTNGYRTRSHSIVRIFKRSCSIAERSYHEAEVASDIIFSAGVGND